MADIFLSYSSEDREKASTVVGLLSRQQWSVWWDRVIPPGRSFDDVIEEALNAARCVIVLWSKNSVASRWVRNEAEEGLNKGILIPVLLEDVKIPLSFKHVQAVDLRDGDFSLDHPEVVKFLDAVSRFLSAVTPPDGVSDGTSEERLVEFRGATVPLREKKALEELEAGRKKPFKLVDEVNKYTAGFVVENNSVVALSLGSWGGDGPAPGLPGSIGQLTNLRLLDLSHAKLTILPESFGGLTSLIRLNLDSNEFGMVPEPLCGLTSLEELNLNYNQLTGLPETFGNLRNLREVSFEHNRLRTLPKSFANLQALEHLDLWENRNLAVWPDALLELKALKELSINGNSLSTIPEGIGALGALRKLRLNMNELVSLPEAIGRLKNLEVLTLGWNKLRALPESLGDLDALKELDLWDSGLGTFPACLCRLAALEKLNLGKNRISDVPEAIENLKALKELRLYNNRILSLPDSIGALDSLERLSLDSNQLSGLPRSLARLRELRHICLTDNPLVRGMDELTRQVLNGLAQNGVEIETIKYGYK